MMRVGHDGCESSANMTDALIDGLVSVFDDIKTGVSMRSFARQHFPSGIEPLQVQVAMYAQGIRYHNSQSRRANNALKGLHKPEEILHSLAAEERSLVYMGRLELKRRRQHAAALAAAKEGRMARLRAEQVVFNETHGLPNLPRIFTPFEADELNLGRPPEDQLEVMPSGLLRHHCTFPNCPDYLVNLSTKNDRDLGFRNGLFRHLRFCRVGSDRSYWPGYHATCVSVYRTHHGADKKKGFVTRVTSRYEVGGRADRLNSRNRNHLVAMTNAMFDFLEQNKNKKNEN
uniref:Uncharacterized protein n=1 Tax=Octactis speculum TaxID=3111310 RepID=A0A7S2CVD6_9STRA|mmetsp:Transcript_40349/g.54906  ORF Transcript_40349/g.54906 Transcript_40349/m.54906 type:complete len:287 (+) Transcript_40349:3-863(+)